MCKRSIAYIRRSVTYCNCSQTVRTTGVVLLLFDIRFSGTPRIEVSRFLAESNPKHHVLSLTFLQVELVAFDYSRWLGVRCGMEVQTVEVQIIIKYICLPIYLRLAFVQSLFRKEKLNCRDNPPQSFYEIQAIGEGSSYWF